MTKRNLTVLNNNALDLKSIRIATPCDMDWNDMRGDERKRHCDACSLDVHNFSEMTKPEIAELLNTAEERVCGRLLRRHDGTFITQDCPVGLAERAWRKSRNGALMAAAALVGAVIFVLALLGSSTKSAKKIRHIVTSEIEHPVAGGMMVAPPDEIMGDMLGELPENHNPVDLAHDIVPELPQ